MPEALAALETDRDVRVQSDPWFTFRPQDAAPAGGVIIPMPLNLAVLDAGAAADVIGSHPEIETWVVGGHSLGGSMAASYAEANSDVVDGLVLWASYPANDALATRTELEVLSIFASNDGLSTSEDIEASRDDLPPNTHFIEIAGGNHAQFGRYGEQPGDGQVTISRMEQQEQIVTATAEFLAELDS